MSRWTTCHTVPVACRPLLARMAALSVSCFVDAQGVTLTGEFVRFRALLYRFLWVAFRNLLRLVASAGRYSTTATLTTSFVANCVGIGIVHDYDSFGRFGRIVGTGSPSMLGYLLDLNVIAR